MSTLLLFRHKYLHQNGNIEYCFPLERKCRIGILVDDRPWIAAFERLMRERRGLQKQRLAELGEFAPSRISTILKGPKQPDDRHAKRIPWPKPDLETLQKLANAFTKYDRQQDPKAPEVPLWEFFVSDEQSAALHTREQLAAQALVEKADPDYEEYKQFMAFKRMRETQAAPPAPLVKRKVRK